MKTATFVWLASVLSFVSISEAVLGRHLKAGDTGTLPRYYQLLTDMRNIRQASRDLEKKRHVTAQMDDFKWRKFTAAIKESLEGFKYTVNEPNLRVDISDVTKVEVLDRIIPIRSITVAKVAGSYIVDLSLEIPKVEITANISGCRQSPWDSLQCTAVVTIDNLSFDLQAIWPIARYPRVSRAEVKKFDVGIITLTAVAIGDGSSKIVPKSALFWYQAVNAVKTGLRNRGTDKNLVRDFVNDIVS